VFGKQNVRRVWRQGRITLSACLRSLPEYGYSHAYELDAERSPSSGGPPV
jgi:hypothetical protein